MMRLRGPILVAAGVVWGGLVFVISSCIGLPITAALFSSGDQVTHMARMVGYGTFLVEHLLFGPALGLVALALRRPARLPAS